MRRHTKKKLDLGKLEKMNAETPGPWYCNKQFICITPDRIVAVTVEYSEFIVEMRNALPELIRLAKLGAAVKEPKTKRKTNGIRRPHRE